MPERTTDADPDYIATGDAARILGVNPRTVARYADGGSLRVRVLPSGHRRVSREDVETLARHGKSS